MYKSPIEIIQSDIQMKTEECILKAIQKIGVNIDKDELIKAIMYDRKQYEMGYADGIAAAQWKWTPVGDALPIRSGPYLACSVRGAVSTVLWLGNRWGTDGVIAWAELPKPYGQE